MITSTIEQLEFIVKQYFLNTEIKTELDIELLHDLTLQNIMADLVAENWHSKNVQKKLLKLLLVMESEDIINVINIVNNKLNIVSPDVTLKDKLEWTDFLKKYLISLKKNTYNDQSEFLFQIEKLTQKIIEIFSKPAIYENMSSHIANKSIQEYNNITKKTYNEPQNKEDDLFYNVVKKENRIGLNIEKGKPEIIINTTQIANNVLNGKMIPEEVCEKLKNNKKMLKAYFNVIALKLIVKEFNKETIFKDSLVFGINFLSPEQFMEFIEALNKHYTQLSIANGAEKTPNTINNNIHIFNKRWFLFIVNNRHLDPAIKEQISNLLTLKITQEKSEENDKAMTIINEMFNIKQYDQKLNLNLRLDEKEIAELFGFVFYKKVLEIGIEMLTESEDYENLVHFFIETLLLNFGSTSLKIALKKFMRSFYDNVDEKGKKMLADKLEIPTEAKTIIIKSLKEILINYPDLIDESEFDDFDDEYIINSTDNKIEIYTTAMIDILTSCDNDNIDESYIIEEDDEDDSSIFNV